MLAQILDVCGADRLESHVIYAAFLGSLRALTTAL